VVFSVPPQRWRCTAFLVFLVFLLWALPVPFAAASCAAGKPFAQAVTTADVVFVGTVLATTDGDRLARVRVEAVWRGFSFPTVVLVNGRYTGPGAPPDHPGWASSEDRHYVLGQRYLFLPLNGVSPFQDSPCTLTRLYTADLARDAPAAVSTPDPLLPTPAPFPSSTLGAGSPSQDTLGTGLLLAGLLAAVSMLTVLVLRRR
jgi:hypothetical protein